MNKKCIDWCGSIVWYIVSYLDQDDNDEIQNLPNDEGLATMQLAPSDRPTHARRDKKAIKGVLCIANFKLM